jgi:hypothetical protein
MKRSALPLVCGWKGRVRLCRAPNPATALPKRRVVGWSMAGHLRTELVLDAMEMAIVRRRPTTAAVFHSDRGTQYTSLVFGRRCREAGIAGSMGSVGDAYDNAVAESFFATLETELIDRHAWRTRADARLAVFDFIEAWYNPHRRHTFIGQPSPAGFERRVSFRLSRLTRGPSADVSTKRVNSRCSFPSGCVLRYRLRPLAGAGTPSAKRWSANCRFRSAFRRRTPL